MLFVQLWGILLGFFVGTVLDDTVGSFTGMTPALLFDLSSLYRAGATRHLQQTPFGLAITTGTAHGTSAAHRLQFCLQL